MTTETSARVWRIWVPWAASLVAAFFVGRVVERPSVPPRAEKCEPPVYLEGDPRNPENKILRIQAEVSGAGESIVELEHQIDKLDATVVELRAKQQSDHDQLRHMEDMVLTMAGDIHRMKAKKP